MKKITATLAGLAGAGLGWTYLRFWQARSDQLRKLAAGSQVICLPQGEIEYACCGEGPAVLLLHGGGGGYDLGTVFSFPEWGYRFISVSRPGYLRTPLCSGETFEQQAELLTQLLDALQIEQAVVVGMSGGGPAALNFALRKAKRCRGLLMMSAISQRIPAFPAFMQRMTSLFKHSDFLFWLVMFTPLFRLFDQGKLSRLVEGNPTKQTLLRGVLSCMFPPSPRVDGILNDLRRIAEMAELPVEQIACPTLSAHADTDTIVPYEQARRLAEQVPGAELMTFSGADHLFAATHWEIFGPAYQDFLQRCWRAS